MARAQLWQDAGQGAPGQEGSWCEDGTSSISSLHPFLRDLGGVAARGGRQLLAPRCSTVGHGHAACTITGWAGGNQTCDKPWDSRCKRCCWWPLRSPLPG